MVFVCNSNDSRSLNKLKNLPWIYIGKSQGLQTARRILDINKRQFIAEDINRICNLVRDNFVDYIGQLSLKQPDKVIWYSSPLASKSVSQTTIFQQYVYQKIIEQVIQKNKLTGDFLVITDSHELTFNAIRIWSRQIKTFSSERMYYELVKVTVEGWIKFIKLFVLWSLIRFLKNKDLEKYDVFLHSWIDGRVFQNTPNYSDCYFADLESFLIKNNYRVARLTSLSPGSKYVLPLRKHFSNIVFPLAYLSFFDFVKVLFSRLSVVLPQEGELVNIKDPQILNVLLKYEVSKENASKSYHGNLMLFYAYKNISKQINPDAAFFYPFENQPWEKMLNLAFSGPRFNRIGYQHTTIPDNWLDYRVSSFEKQPLPNTILTSGEEWSSYLKNFYPETGIKNAGALRFSYLFGKKKQQRPQENQESIVVALPVIPEIAVSLQQQVLFGLREGCFGSTRIIIKPHPYTPKKVQLKRQLSFYSNCEFSDQNISILLDNCKLLISTESSVIFESVFIGIKTLYFVSEQFSIGLESFLREHLFVAYERDFLPILKEALGSSFYPYVKAERFFSTPSYNTFLECLSKGRKQESGVS